MIWKESEPMEWEEMDRALKAASLATYVFRAMPLLA